MNINLTVTGNTGIVRMSNESTQVLYDGVKIMAVNDDGFILKHTADKKK